MIRTIVVGVDDSPAAFHAAAVAVDLAAALGARLVAVSVVDGVLADSPVLPHREAVRSTADQRQEAALAAQHHVQVLAQRAGTVLDSQILHGHVADQLLAVAQDVDADLVVVGRVDRPGVRLTHVGRTAEQVLEFSAAPVLVVPLSRRRP